MASDPSVLEKLTSLAHAQPKVRSLTIKNFGCIGKEGVTIDLDAIVVLVGPNNAGKSTILHAYGVIMRDEDAGEISDDDCFGGAFDVDNKPEIELRTAHFGILPAAKWQIHSEAGEVQMRERWVWDKVGKPRREGFNVETNDWDPSSKPWGFEGVADAKRPVPFRVQTFDDPRKQVAVIRDLIAELLNARVKDLQNQEGKPKLAELLQRVEVLQTEIASEIAGDKAALESEFSSTFARLFPGQVLEFDARSSEGLDDSIRFFPRGFGLRMGPAGEGIYRAPFEKQGSGALRTLLWTALRLHDQRNPRKKGKKPKDEANAVERSHLLLLDEPEICLHPSVIREAAALLYELPSTGGNWQVMLTTHSPVFIDLGRDNTTIVRVDRTQGGAIKSTTLYRPKRVRLADEEAAEIKLLNQYDPYVGEFLFGGKTVLVEGDTEYTAFRRIVSLYAKDFPDVHIVRARGKITIGGLAKILDQFEAKYAVLHDSDRPKVLTRKTKKEIANPAWTNNQRILDATRTAREAGRVVLIASVPNFEEAFFGEKAEAEKPQNAWSKLQGDSEVVEHLRLLLLRLTGVPATLPRNAIEWSSLDQLANAVRDFDDQESGDGPRISCRTGEAILKSMGILEDLLRDTKSRQKRSTTLLRDPDKADPTWFMHVPTALNAALDIRRTPRVGSTELVWTQGTNFSFAAGDVIYDCAAGYKTWSEALASIRYCVQVTQGSAVSPAMAENDRLPGSVTFTLFTPDGSKADLKMVFSQTVTQDDFVRILITGFATNAINGASESEPRE